MKGNEMLMAGLTMTDTMFRRAAMVMAFCLSLPVASPAQTRGRSAQEAKSHKEVAVTMNASGTFEVKLKPLADDFSDNSVPGRMSIDKQFAGDLEGTSKGQMLAAFTQVKDSAGYVAIERVTARLKGRSGSFILQHSGIMTRGEQQATIVVVPDSGTGELVGIGGRMTIRIEGGKHYYVFEYTLPEN